MPPRTTDRLALVTHPGSQSGLLESCDSVPIHAFKVRLVCLDSKHPLHNEATPANREGHRYYGHHHGYPS